MRGLETMFTMERWQELRNFEAAQGEEIDFRVYDYMLNAAPPQRVPNGVHGIAAGFLAGEPTGTDDKGRPLYRLFSCSGDHYYYNGLIPNKLDDNESVNI